MHKWAWGITLGLVLSSGVALTFVWVAVTHPPELVKRTDPWKPRNSK